jgi:hypothetical protein
VRIDGAAINVLGLKLLIGLQAIDSLLQHVEIPYCLPDGILDGGVSIRLQQGSGGIGGDKESVNGRMIAMLIKPRHIGPGAPAFLGRCRPFGTNTHGIKTRGITWQDCFEAHITLPMGTVIIDIPEALTVTETKGAQSDGSGISTVAAIVLAMDVKRVQMFITPVESDL